LIFHQHGEHTRRQEWRVVSASVSSVWYCPCKFQAYGEEEIRRTAKFETMVLTFCCKKHLSVKSQDGEEWGSAGNTLALLIAGLQEVDDVMTSACTFSTVLASSTCANESRVASATMENSLTMQLATILKVQRGILL
jgi:hypothetical protein